MFYNITEYSATLSKSVLQSVEDKDNRLVYICNRRLHIIYLRIHLRGIKNHYFATTKFSAVFFFDKSVGRRQKQLYVYGNIHST